MSEINEALNRFVEGVAPRAPAVGNLRRVAFTPEIRAIDEQTRTIEFVASTESVDRYGDIIRVRGWDLTNYKKNPVFLWGHRSGDPPIGKCVRLSIESNPPALVQLIQFADAKTYPFADQIFRLYQGGFMRAVSVGFRPLEPPKPRYDEGGAMAGYEFVNQELMELSAVPLPANTDAVARAVDCGIVTADDAQKFFGESRSSEPAGAEEVEDLRSLLRQAFVAQMKLSLVCLEATAALDGITRGAKRDADSHEISTVEGLLSPGSEIRSLDQLDAVLRVSK